MLYATRLEMITRYSEDSLRRLTDRTKLLGMIDDATLSAAMDSANSRVSGAVTAAGYPPEFSDPLLTQHACTIAYWHLFTGTRTQDLNDSYNAAIADLNKIAVKTLVLVTTIPENKPSSIRGGFRDLSFDDLTEEQYALLRVTPRFYGGFLL